MSATATAGRGSAGHPVSPRALDVPPIELQSKQQSQPARRQGPSSVAPSTPADADAVLTELFTAYVDTDSTLTPYVLRHPQLALKAIRALRDLPAFDAVLPNTAEAGALRDLLLQHAHSRRVMLGVSAVLAVPTEPGAYTLGPDRGTVRRKIRAAEKQGVTVRPVRDDEREHLLALANRHELTNERPDYRIEQPDNDDLLDYALWLVALDGEGSPIMLSVTPVAGEWGVLRYFRTLVQGQASSDARYLMTREVAEALREHGVRHLVDSSRPHWLPNGLRHFQRMVGFRLVRVRTVRITAG